MLLFSFLALLGAANHVLCPCLAVVPQGTVCPVRGPRAQARQWPVVSLVPVVRVHSHLWRGGHLPGKTLQ